MTAPPPEGSPLAALVNGEPINALEERRNDLRRAVADLEEAITESESRAARVRARIERRADAKNPSRDIKGAGGPIVRPSHGSDASADDAPRETWRG